MRTALAAFVAVAVAALLAVGCGSLAGFLPSAAAESADITLPLGFQVSVYAGDVPNARQMAAGPDGVVFVGSRSEGKVYAVVNRNGQHRIHVLASGLNQPSGLAFRDGSLYVAAVNRILRFRDAAQNL
jgi:glucose/arabinose dehydrogenase